MHVDSFFLPSNHYHAHCFLSYGWTQDTAQRNEHLSICVRENVVHNDTAGAAHILILVTYLT